MWSWWSWSWWWWGCHGLANRDDRKTATESQPTASTSKEGKSWHLTVSSHLHVVRVLHEDLIPETSENVKERYRKPHPSDKNVVLGVFEDQIFKICFSVSGFVCGFRRWSVESVLSRLLLAVIGHRTSWVKSFNSKVLDLAIFIPTTTDVCA